MNSTQICIFYLWFIKTLIYLYFLLSCNFIRTVSAPSDYDFLFILFMLKNMLYQMLLLLLMTLHVSNSFIKTRYKYPNRQLQIIINMKIFLQLIQNYLNQEVPTIILTIDKQKYIFNMASCFQRFIKDHKQKFPSGSNIFFTKANTDTLAGLSGFMLTIFQNKNCQDTKLFVNDALYDYLQQIRYKMGFKMLPYSYLNMFTGKSRSGIRYINKVYELLEKESFPQIFLNSEQYIRDNLSPEDKNQSSRFFNPEIRQFFDGNIRIQAIQIEVNGEKTTNYICIPNKLEGKVLMNKVKEFKIPPQQISKLLSEGFLVLESGQKVMAQLIKEPDQPSPNFFILHHTCIQSIQTLIQHPDFQNYLKNKENNTNSIIHIVQNPPTNERIVESDAFRYLINSFDNSTTHIVYNRHYRNQNYNPASQPIPKHIQLASFVNKYFPTCMPNILGQHANYIKNHWGSCSILEKMFPQHTVLAYKRCHQLILAPKKSQGYFMMQDQAKQKQKRQLITPENIKKEEELEQMIKKHNEKLPFDPKHINPEVVFLGTGSMKPSKYRNVSGIFVEMSKNNSILFDCGEGSYYQLFNHFGKENIDDVMMSIRIIFITHIHSDHNLGILDLIAERNKLLKRKFTQVGHDQNGNSQITVDYEQINKNKLFLIIPFNVLPWFHSYISNIENLLEGCELVFVQTILGEPLDLSDGTVSKDQRKISKQMELQRSQSEMKDQQDEREEFERVCEKESQKVKIYFSHYLQNLHDTYHPQQQEIYTRFNSYLESAGITKFLPVHVDHCPQSFAIVVEHHLGAKISYSGDCRPSLDFAKQASQSTLMIHEATFGDDLVNNARQNMHTTVGQALDIALTSESWKLALTHFSQRYVSAKEIVNPSVYKFDERKRNYAENHAITCFDHLRMRFSELPEMTYYSKKICEIFPSDSQE